MSGQLRCLDCGRSGAVCVDERGWHGHWCPSCGYCQMFTKGSGSPPLDLIDIEEAGDG